MDLFVAGIFKGLDEIRKLREEQKKADKNLFDAIARRFSPGASISWKRGGYRQEGRVISVSDDRLYVFNNRRRQCVTHADSFVVPQIYLKTAGATLAPWMPA